MSVFDLAATLTLDSSKFDVGINNATAKGKNLSGTLKKLGGVMGTGIATAAKVGVAGLTAASAAVGALVKKAVDGYGEFEQLVGGVETLFGVQGMSLEEYAKSEGKTVSAVKKQYSSLQSAQSKVLGNAANAYKTAGLSANDYMETVTSFAAALTSSVGGDTQKAADYAQTAITDMADNANKMGSSIGSIQNAYQGFAKQNYSMLDNLKLGYGGTSQEMYRLMKDAASLNKEFDKTANFSLDEKGHLTAGYNDIVQAIHIVQDNMGITGTTAKEASTTIQGSTASMKAAWSNLIVGIADDNSDFGTLVDNFVDSLIGSTDKAGNRVGGVLNNILPRIEIALDGVSKLVTTLIPVIIEKISPLITKYIPQFLNAGVQIVTSLMDGISENSDTILSTIMGVFTTISDFLIENIPSIVEMGFNLLVEIMNGLIEALPDLIPNIIQMVTNLVQMIIDNAPAMIEAALQLIIALVEGFTSEESINKLIDGVVSIVDGIVKMITEDDMLIKIIRAGVKLFTSLIERLPTIITKIADAIPKIIDALVTLFTDPDTLLEIAKAGITVFVSLIKNLPQILLKLGEAAGKVLWKILSTIGEGVGKMVEIGGNLLKGLWEGIKNFAGWLWEKISNFFSGIWEGILNFFGIHSPSTLMRDKVGKMLALGLGLGFEDEMPNVIKGMQNALPDSLDTDLDVGYNLNPVSGLEGAESGASEQQVVYNNEVVINAEIRDDSDIDKLAEAVSDVLGFDYTQRSRAYV